LWQIGGILRVRRFPLPITKTDRHDITEILLKVTLNIVTLILFIIIACIQYNMNFINEMLLIKIRNKG
jgi:hypothetical protein